MVQHGEDEYMTIEEAAVELGVSRRTVERYAKDDKLKRYRRGLRIMFKRADILRLIAEAQEIRPDEKED